MDPEKVDRVANWKTPDCEGIRIPMGDLTPLTGTTTPWRWGPTEQRAFESGAPPILLITDASLTGASGVLAQGEDMKSASIAAFWSGKFNSAQQNYPVHEQELFAIVESLKRFSGYLYGAHFRILTDHKGLEFILTQKSLSPGETNLLADALSRIYSADPAGVVRSRGEFASLEDDERHASLGEVFASFSRPVYTGPLVDMPAGPAEDIALSAIRTRASGVAGAAGDGDLPLDARARNVPSGTAGGRTPALSGSLGAKCAKAMVLQRP